MARIGSVRDRLRSLPPETVAVAVVALGTGVAVFVLASTVFEYHSSNHDEAVYLQQAAMLLDGQLKMAAGDLTDAFHPWFFIEDGGQLYPKYSPVPAAMYALSMALFDEPRVTLAVVAAANTGLVYLLGTAVADRRVGLVSSVLFALSPMAVLTGATFLPYAPTTLFNLIFAVAYLRGVKTGRLRWGVAAGTAIGIAFFARPYTAVLFAVPFILHAVYTAVRALSRDGVRPLPAVVARQGATALSGLVFVGVTLAYNARLTGDPIRFPYEEFAPLDGPGFGRRRILGHSLEYTPEVALRANGFAVRYLTTRWVVAGLLGTLLAVCGAGLFVRTWRRRNSGAVANHRLFTSLSELNLTAGTLLLGTVPTVVLGNVPFWGNYNALGTLSDPTDGLVAQFGPFYHFDLLVPVAVFAAFALVAGWRLLGPALAARVPAISPQRAAVVGILVSLLVVSGVSVALVSTPLDRNAGHAEKYDIAYEPIESTNFENDLVFVPTPYGEWQNHPFQVFRNDPGFDGPVVYALNRDPAENFAVLDAYPDREYHRYTYRGEWTPNPDNYVQPKLESLSVRHGKTLDGKTTVGVPARVEYAHVRLTTDGDGVARYTVDDPSESVATAWSLTGQEATLAATGESVPVDETDTVVVTVTLVQPDGATLTYRQEATVRTMGDRVEVIWPPERMVCPLTTDCGLEGTYLADETQFDGVGFKVTLEARE
nr:glycosyltransferase family 39 protein [Halovenus rubra]